MYSEKQFCFLWYHWFKLLCLCRRFFMDAVMRCFHFLGLQSKPVEWNIFLNHNLQRRVYTYYELWIAYLISMTDQSVIWILLLEYSVIYLSCICHPEAHMNQDSFYISYANTLFRVHGLLYFSVIKLPSGFRSIILHEKFSCDL